MSIHVHGGIGMQVWPVHLLTTFFLTWDVVCDTN